MTTEDPSVNDAGPPAGRPLDVAALEAIHHFSRVMIVRCGYDSEAVDAAMKNAVRVSRRDVPTKPGSLREIPEASHIATLWHSNVEYVDANGKPLPLPLRGKEKSIEALTKQINPNLDLEELANYLLRTNTVDLIGEKYVLRQPWVMLRGIPGSAHDRSMRGLLGALRTYEHNLMASSDEESWFEFMAETPQFPISKLSDFDKLLRRLGIALLRRLDAYMRHCEAGCAPGEPTVWLGVGTYHFQHDDKSTLSSSTGSSLPVATTRDSKKPP